VRRVSASVVQLATVVSVGGQQRGGGAGETAHDGGSRGRACVRGIARSGEMGPETVGR